MGQFLSMSGVIAASRFEVEGALRGYATANDGEIREAPLTIDDDDCLVICEGSGGVTTLYPGHFFDWDDASRFVSLELRKPVFSLHIHDGDLWMYLLFAAGDVVDRFNPIPDYWEELDDAERGLWQGNAKEVARIVPNLSPEAISRYLVRWSENVVGSDQRTKAYPDDEFYYGDDWQLVDFMRHLGLEFPIDDHGSPSGATYRFSARPVEEAELGT